MAAQHIGRGDVSRPVDVVRRLLGLQAQDFPGVKWSVGLRQAGATERAGEAACDAGEIVRAWPLRGTLHLVAGEDLGWLLALTAPRAIASTAGRRAALGITEEDIERAREAALSTLSGRRVLTRDALLGAFDAAGVSPLGQRGYHLLWYLAQTGTLVLGPTDGREQAFALLDECVPQPRRLVGDAALGELALRYFRSHGPATAADLARWSGLTVRDARRGIEIGGPDLTTLELDGVRYHLAPETLTTAAPAARVHILPGFDEYLLGYRDRTAALAPEHSAAIVPGGNGVFKPTIVAEGEVVGTWRRSLRAGEIVVEAAPFARLPSHVREGLEQAVEAYGVFAGRPARLASDRPD